MRTTIAKLLILLSIVSAGFFLWKGMYAVPEGSEDTGLQTAAVVAGTATGTSPTATASKKPVTTRTAVKGELPARLIIPKLDIDTDVQHVGLARSGNMAAPNNFSDVSWYKYGAVPGQVGSAVMAGHEDDAIATPAVFYHLSKLNVGDDIYVVRGDGKKLRFQVVDKKIHPYNLKGDALNFIFNASDAARLNLITCAGDWLPSAKTNDKRIVIYTKLVE